jgi:hypothetical protein
MHTVSGRATSKKTTLTAERQRITALELFVAKHFATGRLNMFSYEQTKFS